MANDIDCHTKAAQKAVPPHQRPPHQLHPDTDPETPKIQRHKQVTKSAFLGGVLAEVTQSCFKVIHQK